MKLEYEEVEDSYDDTTQIRTMTEQAVVPKRGMLLRTTIYSHHHSASVSYSCRTPSHLTHSSPEFSGR
jgi:hypothetical protein